MSNLIIIFNSDLQLNNCTPDDLIDLNLNGIEPIKGGQKHWRTIQLIWNRISFI